MKTLDHILKTKIKKTKKCGPKALFSFPVSWILREHGILVMTVFLLPNGHLATGYRFVSKTVCLQKQEKNCER